MKKLFLLFFYGFIYIACIGQTLPCPDPTNVSASPFSICFGEPITLSGTSSTDTILWYTQAVGGVAFDTTTGGVDLQTIPPATGTNTFYAEAIGMAVAMTGGTATNFSYTNNVQTFTVPSTGPYLLEVWGAEGGYRSSQTYSGKGGYSRGEINLTAGQILYIYVGGFPGASSSNQGSSTLLPGGFNGGGSRYGYPGGGGATHIATASGLLSTLSGNQSAVLLVAGGGGSCGSATKNGMFGGGLSGGTSTQSWGSGGGGGTQTAGGAGGSGNSGTFGQGGTGLYANSGYAGAGGGGWYGGGGSYPDSSVDDDRGGGGGSGYIGGVTNGQTIAGNLPLTEPNGTTSTGHTGHGYARIISLTPLPCVSDRIPVMVSVNELLDPPTDITATPSTLCLGDTTYLSANTTGDTISWYTSLTAPNPIAITFSGESIAVAGNSTGDITYYVETTTSGNNLGTPVVTDFDFTGSIQTYTAPATGIYQLEVWGAEGGYRSSQTYSGKGGYSKGEITLIAGQNINIYVGGFGGVSNTSQGSSTLVPGGYNGGGARYGYPGGGGATHIATSTGLLSTLSGNQSAVLLVAGGGGSCGSATKNGMFGGGLSGGTSTQSYGSGGGGGTQTAGGAGGNGNSGTFGQGGTGLYANSGYAGAGGGGWYGGGGSYPDSSVDDDRGGGGGSGYIGGVTNGQTIAGNQSFVEPSGNLATGHSGNGYARITPLQIQSDCPSERIPVTFTVNAPYNISITPNPAVLTCANPTIELTATANGNATGYSYQWSGGTTPDQNTNTFSEATSYSVTATDIDYGCTATNSITITIDTVKPNAEITNHTGSTTITCYVPNIQVTASGATNYSWSNGYNTAFSSITSPGTHTVTVTSTTNGCQDTASITTTIDTVKPNISFECASGNFEINCNVQSITVTASGGDLYHWSGGVSTNQATNTFINKGTYTVTATNNANGCTQSRSAIIEKAEPLTSSITVLDPILCYGDEATISVEAQGGRTPYTGTGIYSVLGGTHSYNIVDANNCETNATITFPQPPEIKININQTDSIKCYGDENASLLAEITGGIQPYMFQWSNSDNTFTSNSASINNLPADLYTVTITDKGQCSKVKTVRITQPDVFLMNFVSQDINCYGKNNGKLNIISTGGTLPYSYEIIGNDRISNFSNYTDLAAGYYSINVKDANNCSQSGYFTITEPEKLELSYTSKKPTCIDASNGEFSVFASGGLPPYKISFNNSMYDKTTFDNLSAGKYDILVSDQNNCYGILNNIVIEDNEIDCLLIPNAITPNGDNVNDTWQIEGLETFDEFSIKVFNIWGQLLYKSNDLSSSQWDGKYNNKLVATGTYLYLITTPKKNFTGSVTVIY